MGQKLFSFFPFFLTFHSSALDSNLFRGWDDLSFGRKSVIITWSPHAENLCINSRELFEACMGAMQISHFASQANETETFHTAG